MILAVHGIIASSKTSGAPPSQRTFNVGAGSGNLVIDGADQTKPWYPLQDNDKFVIAAGSYQTIDIQNINKITEVEGVNENDVITMYGVIKNATGLVVSNLNYKDSAQRSLVMSETLKDIIITDCKFANISNYAIHLDGKSVVYPAKAAENIKILYCDFGASGNVFMEGQVNYSGGSPVDNGFIDGFEVAYCTFHDTTSQGTLVSLGNSVNYKIHHNTVKNVNLTVTPGTLHARLFFAKGIGEMYNNRAEDYYGNLCVQWLFTRGSTPASTRMYNNIGINSQYYSLLEVQTPAELTGAGVTYATPEIYYNTAINMGQHPNLTQANFASVVVDVYVLNGATPIIRNNVGINVLAEGNQYRGYNFVINPAGPTIDDVIQSNNLPLKSAAVIDGYEDGYNSYTDAGYLNLTDLKMSQSSPLRGTATPIDGITLDYYAHLRSANTPSVGAVEDIV